MWKNHIHALYTGLVYSQIGTMCEFTISRVSHVLTCRYRRFSFERSYQNFGYNLSALVSVVIILFANDQLASNLCDLQG